MDKNIFEYVIKKPSMMGADNMPSGKTKQGIVGKYPMASKRKGSVGPGIDFVENHLGSGPEISKEFKKRRNEY